MFKSVMSKIGGVFKVECRDALGNIKWSEEFKNGWTDLGLRYLMDLAYKTPAPTRDSYYLGLIGGTSPTLAGTDTMASHVGWTETVAYTAATRPVWGQDNPTGAGTVVVTNSTVVAYTINNDGIDISGVFITTNNTKSGTNGTLIATGTFTSGYKTLATNDILNVTYTLNITAA